MKKYVGTLLAGISLMTVLPLAASAADTDKTTEAEIELTQDPTNKDISLDEVPGVNLGSHVNQNSTETYTADSITGAIKVTNPGNTDGWNVTVATSDYINNGDSSKTLRGAALTFDSPTVTADDAGNISKLPTSDKVTVNGNAQSILTAEKSEGIGQFTATHSKDNVSLLVPAGNAAGSYTATLTWTLSNAPK